MLAFIHLVDLFKLLLSFSTLIFPIGLRTFRLKAFMFSFFPTALFNYLYLNCRIVPKCCGMIMLRSCWDHGSIVPHMIHGIICLWFFHIGVLRNKIMTDKHLIHAPSSTAVQFFPIFPFLFEWIYISTINPLGPESILNFVQKILFWTAKRPQ